jgi:hypothetical protein
VPDETFSGLFEETADLDWAPTEGLRRRARQRRRRQRFATGAAAAAVVAVVAAGAAFAIDRGPGPDPVPPASPAPSVSPSVSGPAGQSASSGLGPATGSPPASSSSSAAPVIVTVVPLSAMLSPADAGSSGWSRNDDGASGDWTVAYTISRCPSSSDAGYAGSIDDRAGELTGPGERSVIQSVRAFPTVAAARSYLSWVRTNVNRCASFQLEQPVSMSIPATGFAGDESLTVKIVGYDQKVDMYGFVREGNLVTEILPSENTQARVSQLGGRAASRMCAVTRTC